MLEKQMLRERYERRKRSMKEIANDLGCSENKVVYWMEKHGIKRRSLSDAIYIKNNPNGDPFTIKPAATVKDGLLLGLGLGLFWGRRSKVLD